MSDPAKKLLDEIIAFFSTCQEGLGDGWAHDSDFRAYGLDYRHRNGTQLWLDLEDDGTIHILWKPVGQDKPTIMHFHAAGSRRIGPVIENCPVNGCEKRLLIAERDAAAKALADALAAFKDIKSLCAGSDDDTLNFIGKVAETVLEDTPRIPTHGSSPTGERT